MIMMIALISDIPVWPLVGEGLEGHIVGEGLEGRTVGEEELVTGRA